jgi:hypothetical protein
LKDNAKPRNKHIKIFDTPKEDKTVEKANLNKDNLSSPKTSNEKQI